MQHRAFSVSWNLTQRCNLTCAHCYLSAHPGADPSKELTTDQCLQIVDDIAAVNPNIFLILTGGEPLIRKDLFEIAGYAFSKGFTVVLGTNGLLLSEQTALRMRDAGILGASISIDSIDADKHDRFRRHPGAWKGAVRATETLKQAGLDFSIHFSVTTWNVTEIPKIVELSKELGAKVLNLYFLVRTGRAVQLTDITPGQYEQVLTFLADLQGIGRDREQEGQPPAGDGRQERSEGTAAVQIAGEKASPAWEDPWSAPVGHKDGLVIRAKCAPFFRRIIYERDPGSPLLQNYAQGSCPAGRHYCRITPEGDVTPCPYMPVSVGNLLQEPFTAIWEGAALFQQLRSGRLGGRCGSCEFTKVCGGCRCRAYAVHRDPLAEDPACAYQPGAHGGKVISLPEEMTFGIEADRTLAWTPEAEARLSRLPSFARGMVMRGVERYAKERTIATITPEVMRAVREKAEEAYGKPFQFRNWLSGGG